MPVSDPIKHVVLLMMENHSFDEMLGCFQEKYPDLDGIDRTKPARFNLDKSGNHYYQLPKSNYCMHLDPRHERDNVKEQISDSNAGFIKNFIANYPSSSNKDRDNLMGYYPRGFLPALHTLAEDFTIPPDEKNAEYDFRRQGVRVPALLISPWVARAVTHTQFDHTSLLKYLTDKWELGPLGERTAHAQSIGQAINQSAPRNDTIGFIRVPFGELIKDDSGGRQLVTGHHNAIHILADYLENEMKGIESSLMGDAVSAASRTSRMVSQTKNAGIGSMTALGRGLQLLGNMLASAGIKVQETRVNKTRSVADDLIEIGRHSADLKS